MPGAFSAVLILGFFLAATRSRHGTRSAACAAPLAGAAACGERLGKLAELDGRFVRVGQLLREPIGEMSEFLASLGGLGE
jgi:hypothetical protein